MIDPNDIKSDDYTIHSGKDDEPESLSPKAHSPKDEDDLSTDDDTDSESLDIDEELEKFGLKKNEEEIKPLDLQENLEGENS